MFRYMLFIALCAVGLCGESHLRGEYVCAPRRGRVLILRGAFSVFSLGMDDLGAKIERCGVDVAVVPAFMSSAATGWLIELARRGYVVEPIVLIGHSKGGHLTAECARQLQACGLRVRLIIIVDNPNRTVIPANVERCVNFYHTNFLGLFHGFPATGDPGHGCILNVDIDQLPDRRLGGYIDHFNMDSSPWVHDKIIREVLSACRS